MRSLLKLYLFLSEFVERRFFYYYCKLSGDTHPKNWFDFRHRDFLERVSPSDVVADLGCGTGSLARKLAPRVHSVLGLDLSARPEQRGNLRFSQVDILSSACFELLRSEGVNTLVLSHVLEHLPDPVGFLGRLPAGKLLVCVPSCENWRYGAREKLGLNPLTDDTHVKEYSRALLREEVEKAGFNVEEVFFNGEGEIFLRASKS